MKPEDDNREAQPMTAHDEPQECKNCDGKGWYWVTYQVSHDDSDQEQVECNKCKATGFV